MTDPARKALEELVAAIEARAKATPGDYPMYVFTRTRYFGALDEARRVLALPAEGPRMLTEAEAERMLEALRWAMGTRGQFRYRKPGEGNYWWRAELAQRAGLFWDGVQFQVKTIPQSKGPQ